MKDTLEVKWPWSMIWIEYADEIIAQIKEALPPDHENDRRKRKITRNFVERIPAYAEGDE